MDNKFKNSILFKFLVIWSFFSFVIIFSFIIAFALTGWYPHDEAVVYLNQFDRLTDLAVTDGYRVFCCDNISLDIANEFKLDKVNRIAYVDRSSIYIISYKKATDSWLIYKSDYELKETELIFEFSCTYQEFKFLNSDLFFYFYDNVYYTYQFSTNTTTVVEEDFCKEYKKAVNKYTVYWKANAFSSVTTKYFIVDNITGEEKTVTKTDFMVIEQVKYLKNKRSFSLGEIYAVSDNVYMIGYTNGCAIIFKYDFENNSVKYYSWIDTYNLISEPRHFYFF